MQRIPYGLGGGGSHDENLKSRVKEFNTVLLQLIDNDALDFRVLPLVECIPNTYLTLVPMLVYFK